MKLKTMIKPATAFSWVAGALLLTSLVTSRADERAFSYTYEADILPKGGWEFEQWLTHRRGHSGESFSRWDFREEIEYGLAEKVSTALYLNFKQQRTETDLETENEFEFEGISSEWRYQLFNPQTSPVGVTLYFEPTYNGHEAELEEKVILSRNFGEKWIAAFNATLEQEWEWEHHETEEESVLEFTGGVSYKLTPHWWLGLEGRNHRIFEGLALDHEEASAWFLGPTVHYGSSRWWANLTVLPQVAGSPDTHGGRELIEHEKVEVRLLVGINF
jgi:hypothetical protein